MSYTVTLDGIVLRDEPMGLESAKLQVYRDTANPGIFNIFTADITFWGDGYDILYGYYNTEVTCKTVPISIVEDCDDGFVFEGLVYVDDLEVNLVKCTIDCSIEDDSPMGRINRYADTKVSINNGKSMSPIADGGVTIAPVGSYKKTPYASGTLPGSRANLRWFTPLELMNYVTKYITDGKCDVVSNYLTDPAKYYDAERWTITIYSFNRSPFPVNGFNFRLQFNDVFGNTVVVDEELPGVQPWAIAYNMAQRIGVKTWNQIGGGPVTYFGGGENKGDRPTRSWASAASPPNPATDPGYIYLEFPWRVDNVQLLAVINNDTGLPISIGSPGSGAAFQYTIQKTSISRNYGATGLIMTSGDILKGGPENINVSFNDVVQNVFKPLNLSIRPQSNGNGTYTLFVEPEPATLSNNEAFEIKNIQDLMLKRNNAFAVSALSTGINTNNDFYLHQSVGYTADSCANESYSVTSSFAVPKYADVFKRTDSLDSEVVYMAEVENPISGDVDNVAFYETTYSAGLTLGDLRVDYIACYTLLHPFVARNNVNKSRNGFFLEGQKVPRSNGVYPWWPIVGLDIQIKNEMTFEYPLKPSELNILLADPYKYILCDGRRGWIKSIEYDIKTGMTNFELLTE